MSGAISFNTLQNYLRKPQDFNFCRFSFVRHVFKPASNDFAYFLQFFLNLTLPGVPHLL